MAERFTKFNSNYLMRSQHQRTDFGTLLERDWVTTNGLNVLRFGSGRKIWYNSGNFVFTTSNIPSYHKKHKLTTETKEWSWNDCKSADSTVNTVMPTFSTNDLRDYAYYGSCVELIRSTIEDVISDFPGRLVSTDERPTVNGEYVVDYYDEPTQLISILPSEGDVSYDKYTNSWYYYRNEKWSKAIEIVNERDIVDIATDDLIGNIYYVKAESEVRVLKKTTDGKIYYYLENYGIATDIFNAHYSHKDGAYYRYDYSSKTFTKQDNSFAEENGLVIGCLLNNPFQIDLHHKKVNLSTYDNPMRFMSNSWKKYCVKKDNIESNITSYLIDDKEESKCKSDNEGKVLKEITIDTEDGTEYIIYGYYIDGSITYVYRGNDTISIQPQQKYIDEYFASLSGFKKQLLRQDTKPLYMNRLISPVEYNMVMYYPEKNIVWPSSDYCVDIDSMAFSSFVNTLYDIAQKFDELWSDNLYRSMTHEAIKNFDWSYSREYYEGDEQDNIDGGERMQKIIRVMGRVFDDVKVYMDTLKSIPNQSYDKNKNCPEALLSDLGNVSGFDIKSTISSSYDLDVNITSKFLETVDKKEVNGKTSILPKWYPTKNSTDVYTDVCDNEFMRRLLLSSKRIMQSKGTQEAIEMIFGMFGFGINKDYTLEEKAYYTSKMIRSDECVDGTVGDIKSGDDWTKTEGVTWTDVDSTTKGDLAIEINSNKDLDLLYYDDTLSGVPMREVYLGRERTPYLVPYYDNTQLYDGDLIFQGKGGWGKMINSSDTDASDDCFDYQETLSYLHVADTISDLLSVNPYTVDDKDVYYVTNLDDYTDYDENPPMNDKVTMSHYFYLIDKRNVNIFSSWKNIVVKPELDDSGNLQQVDESDFDDIVGDEWDYKTYTFAFKKMQYLDSIFSSNVGNNPHVGYGNYDDGSTYIENMKLPFKYSIDNSNITNYSLTALAKKYAFDDIAEKQSIKDKIQIMNSRKSGAEKTDYVEYVEKEDTLIHQYTKSIDEYNVEKRWYINTKILTITNKVSDDKGYFKDYFKSIIMPYVMQVIPSTTILLLKDFS